jgi:hypothetical protein
MKFVADPAVGADSDLSAAAGLATTGFAAGRWIGSRTMLGVGALSASPGGSADEPAIATTAGGITSQFGQIVAPGSISISTTAAQTGQMEWYLFWIPLVPGARVVAA